MKKKIFFLIPTCLIFLFLTSCGDDNSMFEGSDNIITIGRDLPTFESIRVLDDMDVTVVQGNSQVVDIIVNDNLQDQLISSVIDNTLIVELEDGSYDNATFEVSIQMPNLVRLELDDNTRGNVNFTGTQFEFEVSGSSTLVLAGSADVLTTQVSDDGEINAFGFTTGVLNTTSEDASELEITCNTELNGSVEDAAIVRFRGTPTINAITSDAGEIIDAN